MALNNPAAFARAITVGSIHPIPTFKSGAPNEYGFGYGWFPISSTVLPAPIPANLSLLIDRAVDFPLILNRSVSFPTMYTRTVSLPTVITLETDIPGPIIDKRAEL